MSEPLYNAGSAGYDAFFGQITRTYLPALLSAAHLSAGDRVLDVGTGTGAAAEVAAAVVGPSGSVAGGDASSDMLAIAARNLKGLPVTLYQLDAHALPFANESFDAVVCQVALMFFDNPVLALREFHRVLRPGGYAAVSVSSTPDRSLFFRVGVVIGEHVPSKARMFSKAFQIRDAGRLETMFHDAGFQKIAVRSEIRQIRFASFDAYFGGIEAGATLSGQEYVRLPEDIRKAVRESVYRGLPQSHSGGPFEIGMELLIGSGCR